jgi:hypothetical protein
MDDSLELPDEMDEVLQAPGVIDISSELGCSLPQSMAVPRINRFFRDGDLGYHAVSGDTFRLRVHSRKYPVFGTFTGDVHIIERLGNLKHNRHVYALEGMLRFRISAVWFIGVFALFFLIVYLAHPEFWQGVLFLGIGSAIVLGATYELGRRERDEAADRVEADVLTLRATIENLR